MFFCFNGFIHIQDFEFILLLKYFSNNINKKKFLQIILFFLKCLNLFVLDMTLKLFGLKFVKYVKKKQISLLLFLNFFKFYIIVIKYIFNFKKKLNM